MFVLLNDSLNMLIEKEDLFNARYYYDGLHEVYKSKLEEYERGLIVIENEARANEREKKIENYLQLMYEQKYSTITIDAFPERDDVEKTFYNLASAYNEFYNDSNYGLYIYGLESMPERYLSKITNPIPEALELIESLETLIELRKNETASDFGVIIGMTKDQVLQSQWGEPQTINSTTSNYGTREQWVYGNGHYLYFHNDILVSITTRN